MLSPIVFKGDTTDIGLYETGRSDGKGFGYDIHGTLATNGNYWYLIARKIGGVVGDADKKNYIVYPARSSPNADVGIRPPKGGKVFLHINLNESFPMTEPDKDDDSFVVYRIEKATAPLAADYDTTFIASTFITELKPIRNQTNTYVWNLLIKDDGIPTSTGVSVVWDATSDATHTIDSERYFQTKHRGTYPATEIPVVATDEHMIMNYKMIPYETCSLNLDEGYTEMKHGGERQLTYSPGLIKIGGTFNRYKIDGQFLGAVKGSDMNGITNTDVAYVNNIFPDGRGYFDGIKYTPIKQVDATSIYQPSQMSPIPRSKPLFDWLIVDDKAANMPDYYYLYNVSMQKWSTDVSADGNRMEKIDFAAEIDSSTYSALKQYY